SRPPLSTLFPYTTLFRSLGQQGAGQRRGGRLAVRPRDGDGVGFHRAPAELELADDRHAPRARRRELRAVERHPRTHHDERRAVRSEEHTSELQSLAYLVC